MNSERNFNKLKNETKEMYEIKRAAQDMKE
jgi:hypothetical protein